MSIIRQSIDARNRQLDQWFQNIQQGLVKLPRFQRDEAWENWRITSFLNNIINNLPVGATLVLDVAEKEEFISRCIATAPDVSGRVMEHLLDGQQPLKLS